MTDYTDLKARLRGAAHDERLSTGALYLDAHAAIEELEQRSASADEAMYRAAGLTRRETLPPIEEVVTGIESAVYRLLERTLHAEQRIQSMGGSPVSSGSGDSGLQGAAGEPEPGQRLRQLERAIAALPAAQPNLAEGLNESKSGPADPRPLPTANEVRGIMRLPEDDAREAYAKANPLGGPASMFWMMAERIEAGEPYDEVLRDYGVSITAQDPEK